MSIEEIHKICIKYDIKNYTINEDLSIDVAGNVRLCYKNLIELPLKFRNINGSFDCSNNQLTSLEGAPSKVGGNFYCYYNPLESLKGIPLNLSYNRFFLPIEYTDSDYFEYCKVVVRDLKFKKILKCQ